MELLSSDRNSRWTHKPLSSPAALDEVVANLSDQNATLEDHYSSVVKVLDLPRESYTNKYGNVDAKTVVMDDHTHYPVRVCMPSEQKSNVAVVSGTAWWTHPDLEHYRKIIRSALKLGYPMLLVGPPAGVRAEDVSLSKAVHDLQRIQDNQLPQMNVNPKTVIAQGASRAAVIAFGLSVPQYSNGRKIPYIDATAPPAPRPFSGSEIPHVVKHVGTEFAYVGKTALEALEQGEIINYMKSLLPRDASHATNSARMLTAFLNGETGRIVDQIDPKTAIHIVEFSNDYWALVGEYGEKFNGRKNVEVSLEKGYHIEGIARSSTRRDTHARLERIRDIRGKDGSFNKIDFAKDILPVRAPRRKEKSSTARIVTFPAKILSGLRKVA